MRWFWRRLHAGGSKLHSRVWHFDGHRYTRTCSLIMAERHDALASGDYDLQDQLAREWSQAWHNGPIEARNIPPHDRVASIIPPPVEYKRIRGLEF